MTPEDLADLKNNATLRKRLAKFMARKCFRASKKLEAGIIHMTRREDRREGREEAAPAAPGWRRRSGVVASHKIECG
jgi:hypothetical protein